MSGNIDSKTLPSDIRELTSLRFFAALLVVLFHMLFDERNPSTFLNNLISDGHLGVDLFFILSGFILTHVYISDWLSHKFDYKGFLWKRFSRVYPLHFFMISVFILSYWIADVVGLGGKLEGRVWPDLPWHILLLNAWGFTDQHSWNFPSWSVSAEIFAYLIFPVVLFFQHQLKPLYALAISAIFFIVVSEIVLAQGLIITKMMYNFGIIRILVEFFLGVACYKVFYSTKIPEVAILPSLFIIILVIILLSWSQADERLIVFLLAALIFSVACLSRLEKSSFLRHPIFVYLGEISFATYMVHIFVIMSVDALGSRIGLTKPIEIVFIILMVYGGSVFLHHIVEVPARRFLRRYHV